MRQGDPTASIDVRLTHGHLRYADYPLAVGHYRHDVIVSAEAALDASLGNVLRERFDLGRYPGPLGTCAIVRHTRRPKGAIVVGLGDVGELTPQRLRETFAVALKEYALDIARDPRSPETLAGFRSAAFSTLLVGTDGGTAATLADSILAILRSAIDTNRALRTTGLFERVRVDSIEFVELYEDTATRAAHVITTLPDALKRELDDNEELKVSATVSTAPGGRHFRPASPYDAGWWQRIGVQEKVDGGDRSGGRSDTATQLKFTVLSDRARLEQDVTTSQRALVQELIASATSQTSEDLELSATLYQLLVPAGVQDRISQGGNIVLTLDRVGAGYPFELMATRDKDGLHPLIKSHGIVRQFETEQYDARPEMAKKDNIYVVGNPKTMLWPSLSGAELEATIVAEVASANGLSVTHPTRDAQQMMTSLMTGEYRIIHIAAHGQYDPDPMKSGVVISDRLFISPAEITRLALLPELVFLNCCYLGKMSEARPSSPDPRLASSLAEGFIRAGARAVIAAGWAVADKAGVTFAREFYNAFLTGTPFGEAVKLAREATATVRPRSNTWGAYQCYGNPDFRFRRQGDNKRAASKVSLVTRNESLQALRTLASQACNMDSDDFDSLKTSFGETLNAIPDDWRKDGDLLAAAGEFTGELDDFAKAIEYYGKALEAERASAPIFAAEQLANLMARHAATAVIKGGKVDRNVMEAFQKAEEWFDWLDQMLKPTNERRSLRGSLYKRMATILPDRRLEYLQRSLDSYGFGTDPAAVAGYKSTNALALAFVLAKPSGLAALVARADRFQESMPQQQAGSDRDFWGVVTRPDALLHWHVLHQSLDGTALTNLTAEYAQAWQARPSPRQWASVTDHVYFLTVMTADTRLRCHHPATSAVLEQLHAILTTRNFEGDAPRGAAKRQSRRTAARKTARTRRSKTSTRARPKARRPRR